MLEVGKSQNSRSNSGDSTLTLTDITENARKLDAFDEHEHIWHGVDQERGLNAIVAIHNSAIGPALGGTRLWHHETFEASLTDALRLSRGMTFKSAVAGMPFGGGKAVIIADAHSEKSKPMLAAYADMLKALEGQFFTGEDVGLTVEDADFLLERTPNVTGTTKGGSGNPSPVTAEGVFLGLKAALKHQRGSDELTGVHVAVQGLGSVGYALCEKLHAEGATLTVADIDEEAVAKAVSELGAKAVSVDDILGVDADIVAPCALGAVISSKTIPSLKATIIAGSANNQLALHEDALALRKQGILYAPDYVINAGGLINVAAELAPGGYDRKEAMTKVAEIPVTLTDIFERSDAEDRPTNDIAQEIAMERVKAARKT